MYDHLSHKTAFYSSFIVKAAAVSNVSVMSSTKAAVTTRRTSKYVMFVLKNADGT